MGPTGITSLQSTVPGCKRPGDDNSNPGPVLEVPGVVDGGLAELPGAALAALGAWGCGVAALLHQRPEEPSIVGVLQQHGGRAAVLVGATNVQLQRSRESEIMKKRVLLLVFIGCKSPSTFLCLFWTLLAVTGAWSVFPILVWHLSVKIPTILSSRLLSSAHKKVQRTFQGSLCTASPKQQTQCRHLHAQEWKELYPLGSIPSAAQCAQRLSLTPRLVLTPTLSLALQEWCLGVGTAE